MTGKSDACLPTIECREGFVQRWVRRPVGDEPVFGGWGPREFADGRLRIGEMVLYERRRE